MNKKEINEGVERVKDLMKKLVNENMDMDTRKTPDSLNYIDFECDASISSNRRAHADVTLYLGDDEGEDKSYEFIINYSYSPGDNGSYWDAPYGPDFDFDIIGGIEVGGENRRLSDDELSSFGSDEKIMTCIGDKLFEMASEDDSSDDYEYERDND